MVIEELLAAGAPASTHWVSDRQAGPSVLQHGTEEQRRFFLPRIAAGQCFFSIGMSEKSSGSDLASVAPVPNGPPTAGG
ncbi:acyl-CoA dehydrogenase family protein [Kitasatospora xanthocidica]|uniref:acyl-CoA dehydrogenase family protein n=1 Tax=Kitasatospora xanthocidica TaxID=83382 RepID=UPI001C709DCB|nr:acyl-CoA dehydrogenase family protein [Kitasatospora xanthocidica]